MDNITIYIIFECVAVVFGTFIVYQYITSFFSRRSQNQNVIWGYIIFSMGQMTFSLFWHEPLFLISYTAVGMFALLIIYYEAPVSSIIFSVLLFAVLVIVSEAICAVIVSAGRGTDLQETRDYGLPRVLSIVISRLIEILSIKLLSNAARWKKDKETSVEFNQTLPLLFAQIFSIALAYQVFIIGQQTDGHLSIIMFFSMIGILYVNIIVFWYFDRIKSSYRYKSEKEAAETKFDLQKRYYETLEAHQYETDALWHDMRKHLDAVKMLANNRNANAEEYLSELETQIRDIPTIIKTSQPIISALLTEEIRKAKKENIHIDLDVRLENELKVNPVDLCVLLGNLFDNAFEACCGLSDAAARHIEICLAQKSSAIFIEVKNTHDPFAEKTSQQGKRGFGLKNIQRVVDKHNGDMEIRSDNNVYQTTITIP